MYTKTCTKCSLPKNLDEFRIKEGYRDGHATECKGCEYQRTKQWRLENSDKLKDQGQRWRTNNPEKKRMQNLQRHDIRRSLTPDDLSYIEAISNDPCAYCGAPMEHIDHIDPVSRGGDSDWTNFAPACGSCNRSKSDRSLLVWMIR